MVENGTTILSQLAERVANGEEMEWEELVRVYPKLAGSIENLRRIQSLTETPWFSAFPGAEPQSETGQHPLGTWGSLRILERIGEGSFGEVFRAHDPLLQRDVALKLRRPLLEDEVISYQKHLAEARHLARIRHPNVLPIHGVEIHDGRPGMWTEFVHGRTLETELRSEGPLPADSILDVALHLSRAVRAVHESELIHGDIKTENVMRRRDGHLLLMDFGAGRDRPRLEAGLDDGHAQGTPVAMAPELLQGQSPTVRSDLYALGVLLFRLATGRNPIEAESFIELVEMAGKGSRVPLEEARPGLPPALRAAIEKLLSPSAADRPESAGAFETELSLGLSLETSGPSAEELARIHGMPSPPSPLIGRVQELASIHSALNDRRPVTLVGSGGSGKTRLAQEAARRLLLRYPAGSWWVDLLAVSGPAELLSESARSLGVRDRPGTSSRQLIVEHFAGRRALLLLDNAEHVREAVGELIGDLREHCPDLDIIVTSRAPIRVTGEIAIPVPPLAIPPAHARESTLQDFDAVRLFISRAHRSRPDFVLTFDDAPFIAQICRQLEGIPLSIELAAARIRTLSVREIASRLEQSFGLLMQQGAPEQERHRTLHASIEWSFRMLSESESQLLQRLSIFRGGWTLAAAETVCADGGAAQILGRETLDILGSLVESSLVGFEPGPGSAPDRYRMLELVRDFLFEKLVTSGDEPAYRARHHRYCCALAEEGKTGLQGPEQAEWAERLGLEFDNFEQALSVQIDGPETAAEVMRIASSLAPYWDLRGTITLGVRHARGILSQPDARAPTVLRASLLTSLGILLHVHGEYQESIRVHEESLKISEQLDKRRGVAASLSNMGMAASSIGDLVRARKLTNEALEIMEELGDDVGVALDLNLLGGFDLREGQLENALTRFRRSLDIHRGLGDHAGVALLTFNIAAVLLNSGQPDEAQTAATESLAVQRRVGDRRGTAKSLSLLGYVSLELDEPEVALERAQEALTIWSDGENPEGVWEAVELVAKAASRLNRGLWAARLLSAVDRNRDDLQLHISGTWQEELQRQLEQLRALLGDRPFRRAIAEGRVMNLEEAAACAAEPLATQLRREGPGEPPLG